MCGIQELSCDFNGFINFSSLKVRSDSRVNIMSCKDRLLELDLYDEEKMKESQHPPGTIFSEMSSTVVKVFVKDDTLVKKGDPLFVLYCPLPPLRTRGSSLRRILLAPMPESQKTKIKETLEQPQQSPTVVENTQTGTLYVNVDTTRLDENFNKFDTVIDFSDHLFSKETSPETQQPPIEWVNKIKEDRRLLMEHLPDTIFVRVYESRMDILRVVIIGQKGTPYHDGLFFFDVFFPRYYPFLPPAVRYQSGVHGISPHIDGHVQLYLVNEHDKREYMWFPGTSNMLQLLVFLQDLILSAKPYFNLNGNVFEKTNIREQRNSFLFNENTFIKSLKTMIYTMNKPPKNFEDLVLGHFHTRVHDILMACKAYIEGQKEVGCRVSGINHTSSIKFKKDLISCIKPLVKAFVKIGAKEAQEYLYLSEEKTDFSANALIPNDAENKERMNSKKKKRQVDVDEGTSDSAKKDGKGVVDDAANLNKKVVVEDIIATVNEKNNVNEDFNAAANKKWNKFVSFFFSLLCPRFTNAYKQINPAAKRDKKVDVDEETNDDSTKKESEDVVDEETNDDSTKKESKVLDTDIYPLRDQFTVKAFFNSVISKVLVCEGMVIEKGHPMFVMDFPEFQDDIRDKESEAEYSVIQKILTMNRSSGVGIFSMGDILIDQEKKDLKTNKMAMGLVNEEDDVQENYENFKNFDYVTDIPDHFFSSDEDQPSEEWANKIREEWAILEKQLPETIYVRVDKSRMNLLRAVIIGPQGTPYLDGLFFFDVCFPNNYPLMPPLVHYHSCGIYINPNLHKCGKVDLSLPKITGDKETMWVSGTSTMLELLLSIQNKILTTNPLYNDLTYATMRGFVYGNLASGCYNENCILKSLRTMVHVMNRPPANFEDFVVGHFRNHLHNVINIFNMIADSVMCKDDLVLCKKLIVAAFDKIGAKVPQECLRKLKTDVFLYV